MSADIRHMSRREGFSLPGFRQRETWLREVASNNRVRAGAESQGFAGISVSGNALEWGYLVGIDGFPHVFALETCHKTVTKAESAEVSICARCSEVSDPLLRILHILSLRSNVLHGRH